jgi:hypothetical protein
LFQLFPIFIRARKRFNYGNIAEHFRISGDIAEYAGAFTGRYFLISDDGTAGDGR